MIFQISVIHPSRTRPLKSGGTFEKWMKSSDSKRFEWIVSIDDSDPTKEEYKSLYESLDYPSNGTYVIVNNNRSCVDAINNAAKGAQGNILVVVSDDTDCFRGWDTALLKELEGKEDFLLKTDDGIQSYIVTQTIMDRKYFERDGYIYHPDFDHQFADTYLTCKANILGRLIFSDLKFEHKHYSYSGGKEMPDALHRRNDATWMTGQDTFVRLMKQFSKEELNRITDRDMNGFLRRVGVK